MEIYAEQCSVPSCNKVDFLPFKCDACNQLYCLEHRSYAAHNCTAASSKDFTIVVCPDCKKGLRVAASERNLEGILEKHKKTECPGAPKKQAKCAVCKTKLNLTNRYECPKCGKLVCLKHRFEEEHDCISLQDQQKPSSGNRKQANNLVNAGKPSTGRAPARTGATTTSTSDGGGRKRKGLFGWCCPVADRNATPVQNVAHSSSRNDV
ncbi:unnamed protein product [Amoebophrya sp. A120]|nr:unnamed protein product [Amoebophrya sp. A120]|eukprot:GSA120T00010598001.1